MQPFQPTAAPSASTLAGWMANPNPSAPHSSVTSGPAALSTPPNSGLFSCFEPLMGYMRWPGELRCTLLSCHRASVSITFTCHDPLLALVRPVWTKVPLAFLSFLNPCSNHELHYLVWVPKRLVGHGISCAIEAAPHTTWQHPHCGLPNSRFWASDEACQGRSSTRWGQDSKHQFCTNSPFPCLCQESCLNPIDRMLCSKASAHEFCLLFLVFRRCLINLGWTG